jgi:hypothetical protein
MSPLSQYVSEILIYVPHEKYVTSQWNSQLDHMNRKVFQYYLPIIELGKKNPNVPLYFFLDSENPKAESMYRLHRKEGALDIFQFETKLNALITQHGHNAERIPAPYTSHSDLNDKSIRDLRILIDIMDHPEKYEGLEWEKIPKELSYVFRYILYYHTDFYDHFACDIHNLRKYFPDVLRELAISMKRHNAKTIRDYINAIKQQNWRVDLDAEQTYRLIRRNK